MNQLGLFSGIGGFEEAFRRVGTTLSAVCEIDPKAQSVLRRHFPEAEIIKDVKEISKEKYPIQPDVITGGFPCQDLSVAGRREGLAGKRSGLWFEYLRIIEEYQPGWVVIENVPGLLSSNGGRDLAIILRGLVKCGYGVAWRILDAQYFGLAQRRERVFIVGCRDAGRAAEVLFEREGGGWDSPPSREAGQGIAQTITSGVSASRGVNAPGRRREDDYNLVAFGGNNQAGPIDITTACNAHGGTGCHDFESETFIAHTLRAEGYDASEDGTGRGVPIVVAPELSIPLTASGRGTERTGESRGQDTLIAFTERSRADGRTFEAQEELAYALTNPGSGDRTHSRQIAGQFGVRRLMPIECERLQGFPDGWTATDDQDKEISDSARYRMLGNAVALPVVEWIARRIVKVDME